MKPYYCYEDLPYEGRNWFIEYITVQPGASCLVDSGNDTKIDAWTAHYPCLINDCLDPTDYNAWYDSDSIIYEHKPLFPEHMLDFI